MAQNSPSKVGSKTGPLTRRDTSRWPRPDARSRPGRHRSSWRSPSDPRSSWWWFLGAERLESLHQTFQMKNAFIDWVSIQQRSQKEEIICQKQEETSEKGLGIDFSRWIPVSWKRGYFTSHCDGQQQFRT